MGKIIGNILWMIFGGIETATGYFLSGLILCITIIGIPFGLQNLKLGLVMLFPFNATISEPKAGALGCIGNTLWVIFAGIWIAIVHVFFGALLFITIIGIPFARQHFKFAKIALTPFGREVQMDYEMK